MCADKKLTLRARSVKGRKPSYPSRWRQEIGTYKTKKGVTKIKYGDPYFRVTSLSSDLVGHQINPMIQKNVFKTIIKNLGWDSISKQGFDILSQLTDNAFEDIITHIKALEPKRENRVGVFGTNAHWAMHDKLYPLLAALKPNHEQAITKRNHYEALRRKIMASPNYAASADYTKWYQSLPSSMKTFATKLGKAMGRRIRMKDLTKDFLDVYKDDVAAFMRQYQLTFDDAPYVDTKARRIHYSPHWAINPALVVAAKWEEKAIADNIRKLQERIGLSEAEAVIIKEAGARMKTPTGVNEEKYNALVASFAKGTKTVTWNIQGRPERIPVTYHDHRGYGQGAFASQGPAPMNVDGQGQDEWEDVE